jgi:hypothetical protein
MRRYYDQVVEGLQPDALASGEIGMGSCDALRLLLVIILLCVHDIRYSPSHECSSASYISILVLLLGYVNSCPGSGPAYVRRSNRSLIRHHIIFLAQHVLLADFRSRLLTTTAEQRSNFASFTPLVYRDIPRIRGFGMAIGNLG